MTYIKPDPEVQEEQEDLIMSYLNADYLSADTPLSPPSSTSSSSDTAGSPEKQVVDDFMLDINSTTDFLSNENWATNNLFNPCFPQQPQHPGVDLLDAFPFLLPPNTNFIQPIPTTTAATLNSTSSSASTCSLSDSEQPKKKRGRKKRELVTPNVSTTALAPKPLAPRPNLDAPILIKSEPNTTATTTTTINTLMAGPPTVLSSPKKEEQTSNQQQLDQKQVQIQKRQERLIKNRAAALLSRKRKREHLTCLEEEKQTLVQENEQLNKKVNDLETRIQSLEKENLDLKQRLQLTSNPTSTVVSIGQNKRPLITSPKSSKASGVVFMIILFSFALFTLPSRTADRLTVGGSSVLDNKKQFPLIGSSNYNNVDYAVEQYCQTDDCSSSNEDKQSTTDLVLIDAVRPRDLQTWINHKLDNSQETQEQQRHVYLYSKEFSQIAPIDPAIHSPFTTDELPILSLISPYNQSASTPSADDTIQDQKYLQIDVQVLRSTVIRSQLLPLEQCDSASTLLDGMKKDLIINQPTTVFSQQENVNVTPPIIVKREKRANKKLARVIASS